MSQTTTSVNAVVVKPLPHEEESFIVSEEESFIVGEEESLIAGEEKSFIVGEEYIEDS